MPIFPRKLIVSYQNQCNLCLSTVLITNLTSTASCLFIYYEFSSINITTRVYLTSPRRCQLSLWLAGYQFLISTWYTCVYAFIENANAPSFKSPRGHDRHFTDDIFRCIFMNENVWISIKISPMFVPKGPINNIPALVYTMAWCRPGERPLSEAMVAYFPDAFTRPQCVNELYDVHSRYLQTRAEFFFAYRNWLFVTEIDKVWNEFSFYITFTTNVNCKNAFISHAYYMNVSSGNDSHWRIIDCDNSGWNQIACHWGILFEIAHTAGPYGEFASVHLTVRGAVIYPYIWDTCFWYQSSHIMIYIWTYIT